MGTIVVAEPLLYVSGVPPALEEPVRGNDQTGRDGGRPPNRLHNHP